MPRVYERTFQVRHNECDAFGHLSQLAQLHYMQESAYEASEAVGYGMLRYNETNRRWFIRETRVQFQQPIYYGEQVKVRTWVKDFHRVRSIRAYEIHRQPTQPNQPSLVAEGWSDWVYLDGNTLQPVSVPPEMVKAFDPDWQPGQRAARQKFPELPPEPASPFRQVRKVEWRDLDRAQHVNNGVYFAYLEECLWQMFASCGWGSADFLAAKAVLLPRIGHIEYRQAALPGEELQIVCWLGRIHPASFQGYFSIQRSGEIIAQAQSQTVCLELNSRRPAALPPMLRQRLAAFTAAQ